MSEINSCYPLVLTSKLKWPIKYGNLLLLRWLIKKNASITSLLRTVSTKNQLYLLKYTVITQKCTHVLENQFILKYLDHKKANKMYK